MNTKLAKKLAALCQDFAAKTGRPFEHFYCPILLTDQKAKLCAAHIVNAAFRRSTQRWTVQRADVDNFFGSAFESEFVKLRERGRHSPLDVLSDKDLSKKLRPQVKVDNKKVAFYRPGSQVPAKHSEFIIRRPDGPSIRLALKMEPSEVLAAKDRNWQIVIEADVRWAALVSLLKAAHLTLFEMVGYEYALSAAGMFIGHEVLGKFFLGNTGKPKEEVVKNAPAHFREFVNLVRPLTSPPTELRGTASDRLLYICQDGDAEAWAFVVVVRTAETLHAVLVPTLSGDASAARFHRFLTARESVFSVRLAKFADDRWHASTETRKFVWPAPALD